MVESMNNEDISALKPLLFILGFIVVFSVFMYISYRRQQTWLKRLYKIPAIASLLIFLGINLED